MKFYDIVFTAYKILTSTKGQSLIVSQLMGMFMAWILNSDFTAWAVYSGAMFTAWGVGHQNDKKNEVKHGN